MKLAQIHCSFALVFLLLFTRVGTQWHNSREEDDIYKLQRRSRRDDGHISADVLMSPSVNSEILNRIGNGDISGGGEAIQRKRRDHNEVDSLARRAESDAIAAAAESAAAEADAVAAAIEAEEIESENEGGAGDNALTFEENDDGSNVVVVEPDAREREHHKGDWGQNQGHHAAFSDSHGSEFDVQRNGISNDAQPDSLKNWHGAYSSSDSNSIYEGDVENGKSPYADIQTPLNALIAESSGLAKEIRLIFQVLARREDYLVREMDKLKRALQKAIQVLQENNQDAKIRKRRGQDDTDSNPYKACVYINPPNGQAAKYPSSRSPAQSAPLVANYDYDYESLPGSAAALTSGAENEVDLSQVYWLKLPENDDQGILERVNRLLSGVRDSGKDILFIPVSKTYMSSKDVANGFLRAVRVNPANIRTTADAKLRRRRRKLRLRILRV